MAAGLGKLLESGWGRKRGRLGSCQTKRMRCGLDLQFRAVVQAWE